MPVSKNKRKSGKWKGKKKPSSKNHTIQIGGKPKVRLTKTVEQYGLLGSGQLDKSIANLVKKNPDGSYSKIDDKT